MILHSAIPAQRPVCRPWRTVQESLRSSPAVHGKFGIALFFPNRGNAILVSVGNVIKLEVELSLSLSKSLELVYLRVNRHPPKVAHWLYSMLDYTYLSLHPSPSRDS